MTTENRDWITPGATVAVISTGRSTGIKQISMDTIDILTPEFIKTAKGHEFTSATLQAPVGRHDMYLWRIADPEAPATKLALAVQAREKMLTRVHKLQTKLDRNPTDADNISLLITALSEYRSLTLAAEALTEASKASA